MCEFAVCAYITPYIKKTKRGKHYVKQNERRVTKICSFALFS